MRVRKVTGPMVFKRHASGLIELQNCRVVAIYGTPAGHLAQGKVWQETIEYEKREAMDSYRRDWRRTVRNRIGFNHEDRFRSYDSPPGQPVRAELWHAVY